MRLQRVNPPTALLIAAVAASGILLLAWQSHLTFFFDDWQPLIDRRGLSAHSLLDPHVEHLLLSVTLIYKAIQATFGMESLVPYAVVSTSAFLASVVLLFVYMRRRLDEWIALAAVVPVLFLGAAHEDLLWPFQVFFFGAMAFGLGALLVIEGDHPHRDAVTCGLLVLAFTFSELALPFTLGVALIIALDRGPLRRFYVIAVPLVLYGVWYLGWGHTAHSQLSAHNVANSSSYVLDGLAASVASLLGLSGSPFLDTGGLDWGRPLLLGLLFAGALRARSHPVSRGFWVAAVIALSFWLLTAANTGIGRAPTSSRYQFAGAMLTLLVAAELFAGARLRLPGIAIALGVAGFAALSNLSILHQAYMSLADLTPTVRGALAGLEVAGDSANPDLVLNLQNSDVNFLNAIRAGPYLSAVDAYGSPAYTQSELVSAPENARMAADKVMAAALRLHVQPLARPRPFGPGCRMVHPGGVPSIPLPPGGAIVTAHRGEPAMLSLRRFATESYPIVAGTVRGSARLGIPEDRSNRPWQLRISAMGPVTVCPA